MINIIIDTESTGITAQLLLSIASEYEVYSKWYQFGEAVGLSREELDQISNHSPTEAITEVFGCWLRHHKVTQKDIIEILYKMGLQELSSNYALDSKCYYNLLTYSKIY